MSSDDSIRGRVEDLLKIPGEGVSSEMSLIFGDTPPEGFSRENGVISLPHGSALVKPIVKSKTIEEILLDGKNLPNSVDFAKKRNILKLLQAAREQICLNVQAKYPILELPKDSFGNDLQVIDSSIGLLPAILEFHPVSIKKVSGRIEVVDLYTQKKYSSSLGHSYENEILTKKTCFSESMGSLAIAGAMMDQLSLLSNTIEDNGRIGFRPGEGIVVYFPFWKFLVKQTLDIMGEDILQFKVMGKGSIERHFWEHEATVSFYHGISFDGILGHYEGYDFGLSMRGVGVSNLIKSDKVTNKQIRAHPSPFFPPIKAPAELVYSFTGGRIN